MKNVYGSSRLGTRNQNILVEDLTLNPPPAVHQYEPGSTDGSIVTLLTGVTTTSTPIILSNINNNRFFGEKNFELKNHLGNVLSVISDKKLKRDDNNDGQVDDYLADIRSYSDYFPF